MRMFVAVLLPEAVRRAVASVRDEAKQTGASASWVSEDNFHITLKFLGEVPEERAADIAGALGKAVAGQMPFEAEVVGAGAFPNAARARTLWVGVGRGAEEMCDLAERVETELAGLGFVREARRFHPHVTFARLKARPPQDLAEALGRARDRACGGVSITEINLMRSQLSPAGARYSSLAAVPLVG